jgi:hypothetical protein
MRWRKNKIEQIIHHQKQSVDFGQSKKWLILLSKLKALSILKETLFHQRNLRK